MNFKFIEMYALIAFSSATLLYKIGENLADYQWLYIDLVLLIPLSIFMGDTGAYPKLTPHIPTGSLISLPVISSVLSCFAIQFGFQAFSYYFVRKFSFYEDPDYENDWYNYSYENVTVFWVSIF